MTAALAMALREDDTEETDIRGTSDETLRRQYEQLTALVTRLGAWLTGAHTEHDDPRLWEQKFDEYRAQLRELQRLGEQLRPSSLRDRGEVLSGSALADEIRELFA